MQAIGKTVGTRLRQLGGRIRSFSGLAGVQQFGLTLINTGDISGTNPTQIMISLRGSAQPNQLPFSYSIDWGDSSTTDGTNDFAAPLALSHTYASDDTTYTITPTVTPAAGEPIAVVPPSIDVLILNNDSVSWKKTKRPVVWKTTGLSVVWGTKASMPPAPTGLSATPISAGEIDLAWTDPTWTSPALTQINVYRSTSLDGTYSLIGNVEPGTQAYADTTVSGNVTYYYKVAGYSSTGPTTGLYSNVANALTYPGAPTDPSVNGLNLTTVGVSVTPLAGCTVNLYVDGDLAVTDYTNNAPYAPVDANIHEYSETYVNSVGESAQGSATTGAVLPAPPSIQAVNTVNQSTVQVIWTNLGGSPIAVSFPSWCDTNNPPAASQGSQSSSPFDVGGFAAGSTVYAQMATTDSLGQTGPRSSVASVSTDSLLVVTCPSQTDVSGTVTFTGIAVSGGSGTYASATVDAGDGSGPQAAGISGNSVTYEYTYSADGSYTYIVVVTDSDGNTANSGSGPVTVSGA